MLTQLNATAGVVLAYHHVDTETPPSTSISPDQFRRHLDILEEEGFTVLPLSELVTRSRIGNQADRIVAITFDDAFISIYKTAFPELVSRGWPFTVFVATDLVGSSPLYLSWEQLQEMAGSGATIANHTLGHGHLVRQAPEETKDEWRSRVTGQILGAESVLEAHGHASKLFAYTYGEYNPELIRILEDNDFIAFSQQSGAIGPYSHLQFLPRFPLGGVYVGEQAFKDKIRSIGMPIVTPEIDPLVADARPPKLQLSFPELTPNFSQLTCYGPGGKLPIEVIDTNTASTQAEVTLPVGRSRYNCTMPARVPGKGIRFYWFSQLWMKKHEDGRWYEEP